MKLILSLVLVLSTVVCQAADVELPSKENFHLFLLVGQSNMAGRGKVSDADRKAHERVLMFSKKQEWVPAVDPLHFDKPVAGTGLGKTFGIVVASKNLKVTVGLIPCAVGGSPIDSWKVGGYHRSTKTHPYDDAMKRAHVALKAGTLKGILWHQGESDSRNGLSRTYEAKLHELIGRFRKELSAPKIPFIAGQMGQFAERPWGEEKKTVDAAHCQLPNKVNFTAFVNSNGLKHNGDKVHFDSASYRELGKRYAKAYWALIDQK
ncbi:MAG: acetylxylan esterase [Planctomycetaceae bacterium]|nr:acetylxylan esterase [Planctomycetaceae bacterium]